MVTETVREAGEWLWGGQSAIGHRSLGIFYYNVSTRSYACTGRETYSAPTNPYVNVTPSTVYVGQTAYFSWGADDATECYLNGSRPIGPVGTREPLREVDLSDAGTYSVYCINIWGITQTVSALLEVLEQTPTVEITSADLTADRIQVELQPPETSGTLTVTLIGKSGNYQVDSRTRRGGSYSIPFGALSEITEGKYTDVQATWDVTTSPRDSYAYNFHALGVYRHTQYNSPEETSCDLPTSTYYITNPSCEFATGTLRAEFMDAVNRNGSGHSILFNDVAPEGYCFASEHIFPTNAMGNTFRENHTIKGSYGPVHDSTVAVMPGHDYIGAGNTVYIDTVGSKTVTDQCPGCTTNQLDNYTTNTDCRDIRDVGDGNGRFATFLIN